jgi:hypothetical protein
LDISSADFGFAGLTIMLSPVINYLLLEQPEAAVCVQRFSAVLLTTV